MQYEHIATQELTGLASSISFQNIDTIYRFFRLTGWLLMDATPSTHHVRFNDDSGTNYAHQYLRGNNTTVTGARSTSASGVDPQGTSTSDASTPEFVEALIGKSVATEEARVALVSVQVIGGVEYLHVVGAEWGNTADLINRIDILKVTGGNYAAGTRVILEGARVENG